MQKLSEAVTKQEAALSLLKSQRLQWLREYTCGERNLLSSVQTEAERKLHELRSFKEALNLEKTREKALISRFRRKMANYKASKQAKAPAP